MTRAPERLAAIDMGTHSFRLLVGEADSRTGRIHVLIRDKAPVRLGHGAADMKHLELPAMRRAVAALRRFREEAEGAGARIRAVATSAVREALNRRTFLERVRKETDIRPEVVSGPEEARLVYLGALHDLRHLKGAVLLVHIGGGSTELVAGRGSRVVQALSLKLGAMRLTERFFPSGRTDPKAVAACREAVVGFLVPVVRRLGPGRGRVAVGSSGTVRNAARMISLARGDGPRTSLHGLRFSRAELAVLTRRVLSRKPARRLRLPGMDPERADILSAGLIILEEVLDALNIRRMVVSEDSLKEGLLLDTLRGHRSVFASKREARAQSIRALAERCRYEAAHAARVSRLALRLFEAMRPLHGLGPVEEELLDYAARLHDIGVFVSASQHHRHAYYLIRNADLLGFTDTEKEILANLARYHRKSHPKPRHEGFCRLSPDDQGRVRILAGILRIADGLDRTHRGVVRDLSCAPKGRRLSARLRIRKGADARPERWAAEQKKGLLETSLRRKLSFR